MSEMQPAVGGSVGAVVVGDEDGCSVDADIRAWVGSFRLFKCISGVGAAVNPSVCADIGARVGVSRVGVWVWSSEWSFAVRAIVGLKVGTLVGDGVTGKIVCSFVELTVGKTDGMAVGDRVGVLGASDGMADGD